MHRVQQLSPQTDVVQVFDICWGNEPITQYLINGHFVWRPLGPVYPVEYRNPAGTPAGDYVGLNFYSRCALSAPGDAHGYLRTGSHTALPAR